MKFSRKEVKYRSKVCCIAMLKENEAYQSGMNVFSCSLRWPTFSMKKKGGREGRRAEKGGEVVERPRSFLGWWHRGPCRQSEVKVSQPQR